MRPPTSSAHPAHIHPTPTRLRAAALVALLATWCLPAASAQAQKVAAGTISPGTLKLPDGPGSVAGMSDAATVHVFSGQVQYAVPFDLPSASGLAPALSLAYSGSLGNSSVGVGWSLAVPAIRRSLRQGVPSYTDDDELLLSGIGSGGRLVYILSGPYAGEYRVEGHGHAIRVRKVGNRFHVTDADGTQYFLGTTGEGRLEQGAHTAAWFVQYIENTAHRSITYRYQKNEGQVYLSAIYWGPNAVYGAQLSYEGRFDPVVSYQTGFRVTTAWRVSTVRVESFGQELRAYHISYDHSLPLSRLASVRMTGRAGLGELPTLSFTYAQPEPAYTTELSGTGGWNLDARGVALFDIDGDGLSELVRLELGNHSFRKNYGGTFGSPGPIYGASSVELSRSRFIDLDGDARAELVRVVNDTWRGYKIVGNSWEPMGTWPGSEGLPLSASNMAMADINGDGRTDVVRATALGILVRLNSKTGFLPERLLPPVSSVDPPVEPGRPNVRLVDINGDNLADVVWLTDSWMKIFLGTGDGTFVTERRIFYPWGQAAFDLKDLHLADLNRDGLMDLVRVTIGHVLYYPGQGDLTFPSVPRHVARPESTSIDVRLSIADINGNGSHDLIWSSPRGMWALDLAGLTSAGLLSGIHNGLGQHTTVTYQASGLLSVAAEQAGSAWVYKLPTSIPVPIRVDIDPGAGTPVRVVHYGVSNGFWDAKERRFGGFLEGRRIVGTGPLTDTLIEDTRYLPGRGEDRVLRGIAWYVRQERGSGEIQQVTTSDWDALPVKSLPPDPLLKKAALRETRSYSYEGHPSSPIETRTTYLYDTEVRPIEEVQLGIIDAPGDEAIVRRAYASDDSFWVRDRVVQEQLFEADDTEVSHQRFYFGDHTATILPHGTLGRGWPRKTEAHLHDLVNPRWITVAEVEYDLFANPIRAYAGGIWRTLGYDADSIHPIRETVSPQTGTDLIWHMSWDNVLGQPATLTDPNGDVTTVGYDDLGRLTQVAQNSLPAHARYAYQWDVSAGPILTRSFVFDGAEAELPALANAWQNGAPWRESVAVVNGAGESLYAATRLGPARWIVSGYNERDARGRTIYVADNVEWPSSALPTSRPPGTEARAQRLTYDALGRLVTQTLPTGAQKQLSYQAFCQTVTADDLAPVSSCSDGLGRVIHTERVVETGTEFVDASYDAAGRITAMTLPQAVQHTFKYDSLGRLVGANDPDIGPRKLSYNDQGWLIEHQNGIPQSVTFTYDNIGRLETRSSDGATFRYYYDVQKDGGNTDRVLGRLGWVDEPDGHVELAYDQFGRAVTTRRTIKTLTASETTTLSPSGLVLSSSHENSSFFATVNYDPAGRAVQVNSGAGLLWQATELDPAGRVMHEQFGNGVTQTTARDVLGQPSQVGIYRPGEPVPGGVRYYDVALTRNAYGAVTDVVEDAAMVGVGLDHNATFAYDSAGRLTGATMGTTPDAYLLGAELTSYSVTTLRS